MMKTDPKIQLETWIISSEKSYTKYVKDMPLIENMLKNFLMIWVILQLLKLKIPLFLSLHVVNYSKITWKTKCKWEDLILWWCQVWCLDKWEWEVILCNKKWWCSNKWVEIPTWTPWWDKVEVCLLWDLMELKILNFLLLKINKVKISMMMKSKKMIMKINKINSSLREMNLRLVMNTIEILIIPILIPMEELIWWVIMEGLLDYKIPWWWTLKCNIWWCNNNNNWEWEVGWTQWWCNNSKINNRSLNNNSKLNNRVSLLKLLKISPHKNKKKKIIKIYSIRKVISKSPKKQLYSIPLEIPMITLLFQHPRNKKNKEISLP